MPGFTVRHRDAASSGEARARDLEARLGSHGLILRGGFHPAPEDGEPDEAATLLLVGNAGAQMWRAFAAGRREEPHPLNAWTRRVVSEVAEAVGATARFPFDGPPYWPFQRWARKAEPVHPSPIGPLILPVYGLWHAYRGALVFRERLALPARDEGASPCDDCADRPCLSRCPVDAFPAPGRYRVPACVAHVAAPEGADCLGLGCRARRACPVGRDYVYEPDQARLHMTAFLAANAPPY